MAIISSHYGISIFPNTPVWDYVASKIREKQEKNAPSSSTMSDSEIMSEEFANEFEWDVSDVKCFSLKQEVLNLSLGESINKEVEFPTSYSDVNQLICLEGEHRQPTMISSPFNSEEEVVEHYKTLYGDILPDDFDYPKYIGLWTYACNGM